MFEQCGRRRSVIVICGSVLLLAGCVATRPQNPFAVTEPHPRPKSGFFSRSKADPQVAASSSPATPGAMAGRAAGGNSPAAGSSGQGADGEGADQRTAGGSRQAEARGVPLPASQPRGLEEMSREALIAELMRDVRPAQGEQFRKDLESGSTEQLRQQLKIVRMYRQMAQHKDGSADVRSEPDTAVVQASGSESGVENGGGLSHQGLGAASPFGHTAHYPASAGTGPGASGGSGASGNNGVGRGAAGPVAASKGGAGFSAATRPTGAAGAAIADSATGPAGGAVRSPATGLWESSRDNTARLFQRLGSGSERPLAQSPANLPASPAMGAASTVAGNPAAGNPNTGNPTGGNPSGGTPLANLPTAPGQLLGGLVPGQYGAAGSAGTGSAGSNLNAGGKSATTAGGGMAGASGIVQAGYNLFAAPLGAKPPADSHSTPVFVAEGASSSAATSGVEHLQRLVSLAEAEVAQIRPGTADAEKQLYVEKHVYLRMLYLMSGQQERALQPIPGLDAADQEFWQQTFWGVANYFDVAIKSPSDRASQTVAQFKTAIQRLQSKANLELKNVTFCHKIADFGLYDRYARDEFSPGQPVLVYAEVENVTSEQAGDGHYRAVLRSTFEILRPGPQGDVVERIPIPSTEDLCRNPRRDFFLSYELNIPPRLGLGPHVLKLTVEDQLSRKLTTYSLNFTVK